MSTLTISELIEKGIPFTENIGLYFFTAFIQFGSICNFLAPIIFAWLIYKLITNNKEK